MFKKLTDPITGKVREGKEAIAAIDAFIDSIGPLLDAVNRTRTEAERARAAVNAFLGREGAK